jgi:hypothetical protein
MIWPVLMINFSAGAEGAEGAEGEEGEEGEEGAEGAGAEELQAARIIENAIMITSSDANFLFIVYPPNFFASYCNNLRCKYSDIIMPE